MKRIERRAVIHVPDSEGPPPVLCFLHGVRESAAGDSARTIPQLVAKLFANGSPPKHAEDSSRFVRPFIVVSPQLSEPRRWESTDCAWVEPIIRAAINEYGGDETRLV